MFLNGILRGNASTCKHGKVKAEATPVKVVFDPMFDLAIFQKISRH